MNKMNELLAAYVPAHTLPEMQLLVASELYGKEDAEKLYAACKHTANVRWSIDESKSRNAFPIETRTADGAHFRALRESMADCAHVAYSARIG